MHSLTGRQPMGWPGVPVHSSPVRQSYGVHDWLLLMYVRGNMTVRSAVAAASL